MRDFDGLKFILKLTPFSSFFLYKKRTDRDFRVNLDNKELFNHAFYS